MNQSPAPTITVRGRNTPVSERFKEVVDQRYNKIAKFSATIDDIDVELTKSKTHRVSDEQYRVEITCRGKGPVVRAEADSADQFTAMDQAFTKVEERLRRNHDRLVERRTGQNRKLDRREMKAARDIAATPAEIDATIAADAAKAVQADATDSDAAVTGGLVDRGNIVYEQGPVLVREKVHEADPMSVEQAVEEMELVGHDFYVFVDQANNDPSVVYRRRAFDYGLIRLRQPEASA